MLLAVVDQLISGIAMMEIDGVARRMLLCPPDVDADYIRVLIEDAGVDIVVTDDPERWTATGMNLVVASRSPVPVAPKAQTERATEWLMLTSGTSGVPKIVRHTLDGIDRCDYRRRSGAGIPAVWGDFL